MALGNHSTVTEFIFLRLSDNPHVEAVLFVLFLAIYLLTLMGNLMLLLVIKSDPHLHAPMYFFLSHLSFLDLCYCSVTEPNMLKNLLSQDKSISKSACLRPWPDCYAAICHPLLYGQVMGEQLCEGLVWASWGLAFLDALINTLLAGDLDFCEVRIMSHFSCELPSLFPLSCSDVSTNFAVLICSALLHASATLLLIFFSYTGIVSTILSISSTTGRSKAFSTCSSHLTTVILFYGSAFLRYYMPTSGTPVEFVFSIQYSVVTPLVNPLVYSLKNNVVKAALKRMLQKGLHNFR
ncbi:olfactory receptor 8S1-like [Dasypus novemcinctus]|uniref:olfactory receptor 8S1-like n=1 Tax=Dasypus novemcinctus TaxID=9361 RepID=UPI0039C9F7AD